MSSLALLASHWPALAAALFTALAISCLVVRTQHHHRRFTTDSTLGVQKFHEAPTPRVGGLGIYLGLLVAWLLTKNPTTRQIVQTIALAGIPALAFGLLEDMTKRVSVLSRLLATMATMASGVLAWWISGIALNDLDIPLIDEALKFLPAAVLLTAFAVGGVANAINIIDGFHGLASGTVLIALTALAAIAARAGDAPLALACVLVAAAVAGFWLLNFPWGKIFLGDGGAYFAGFALAWLTVLLPMRNPGVSPWAGLMVCAYPVIEVLYSVVRRCRQRQSPSAPDSLHLHSLVQTQLIRKHLPHLTQSQRNAAVSPLMWSYAALPAAIGVAFYNQPPLLLVLGLLACLMVYHRIYIRLAARRRRDTLKAMRVASRKRRQMRAAAQTVPASL